LNLQYIHPLAPESSGKTLQHHIYGGVLGI
jgi:hypothetical protein